MNTYALALKLAAPIFLLVGALHLSLALGADVLLGAAIAPEVLDDPVLDSQNRFYGTAFTLYGVLLFVCATDLRKFATVLRCLLWVFFAAGLSRFVSIAVVGLPSHEVLVLMASEIVLPPLMLIWLSRVLRKR